MTFDISMSPLSLPDLQALHGALNLGRDGIDYEEVLGYRPDLTISQAHDLLDRAHKFGYLEWDEGQRLFSPTEAGHALKASGLRKRIDRKTATAALGKAIIRARSWNASRDCPVVITTMRIFGSYLKDQATYADVDLEISFAERDIDEDSLRAMAEALPLSTRKGCTFQASPKRALIEHLQRKAHAAISRNLPDLSLAAEGIIDTLGADWREAYRFNIALDREQAISPDIHQGAPAASTNVSPTQKASIPFLMPDGPEPAPLVGSQSLSSREAALEASRKWLGRMPGCRIDDDSNTTPSDARTVGHMLWADSIPAWEIVDTDPMAAIRAVHKRGIEEGLLERDDITVTLSESHGQCLLPLVVRDDNTPHSRSSLRVEIRLEQKHRSLCLTPKIETLYMNQQGKVIARRERNSETPAHIAMARALAMPLVLAQAEMKFPKSMQSELVISWNRDMSAPLPQIPHLGGLSAHVNKAARQIYLPDAALPIGARLLESDTPSRWMMLTAAREVSIEISSTTSNPGLSFEISDTTTLSSSMNDEVAVIVTPNDASSHASRIHKEAEKLLGLGPSWRLSLSRTCQTPMHPDRTTLEGVRMAAVQSGIPILDDTDAEVIAA